MTSKVEIKAAIVGAVVASILSFTTTCHQDRTHDDKDILVRVSSLEAHQQDESTTLGHIQAQVDKLVDILIYGRAPKTP